LAAEAREVIVEVMVVEVPELLALAVMAGVVLALAPMEKEKEERAAAGGAEKIPVLKALAEAGLRGIRMVRSRIGRVVGQVGVVQIKEISPLPLPDKR
jgi:hypothetical protein